MSAETPAVPGRDEHYLRVLRRNFRAWRGGRPFWAGLYVMIGGVPIMYFPYAKLHFGQLTVAMSTTAGAGSLIIGVLLVVLGFSLWFQQHVRTFAGVAAILLALVSIPVSNFGGFLVGFLFAMFGGAMAVAWAPAKGGGAVAKGGAVDDGDAPVDGGAPADAGPDAGIPLPEAGTPLPADEPDETKDLSGTTPANGANGRHSAD
ncbi:MULTISPECIES: DUF6114 domain-containing protein [unclassified Streptomyces]|uniref:DUF6114 domain-containing protein n=1 Tax=unclassified Streptomyces TaxID=2593676 RepID=UPI003D740280